MSIPPQENSNGSPSVDHPMYEPPTTSHERMHEVIEPATGEVLYRVGLGKASDAGPICRAAAGAQRGWSARSAAERANILRRAAQRFERSSERIVHHLARETGAVLPLGRYQVRQAGKLLQLAADLAEQPNAIALPSVEGRLSQASRHSLGVIGVISPFNFPLILTLRVAAPALALGNAIVVKPDPRTPVAGGYLIAAMLEEADLPADLFQVLPGDAEVGEALCADPNIAMVSFTGSTRVGRRVGALCGQHLKKVSLELGGKNSLIVCQDADVERAVSNAAWSAWLHQGQICMSAGRILVHESLVQAVACGLASKANAMRVGNPVDPANVLGPLIDIRQAQRVDAIVRDAVMAGATLAAGGTFQGPFYRPTVLTDVSPGMRAFEEEVFGPVASVTAFATDEEAIELANDTGYGLAAGVISSSAERAKSIATGLNVGMVHINDQTVLDEGVNPFGGLGLSGNGSYVGGPADVDHYTRWRWATIKEHPPVYF